MLLGCLDVRNKSCRLGDDTGESDVIGGGNVGENDVVWSGLMSTMTQMTQRGFILISGSVACSDLSLAISTSATTANNPIPRFQVRTFSQIYICQALNQRFIHFVPHLVNFSQIFIFPHYIESTLSCFHKIFICQILNQLLVNSPFVLLWINAWIWTHLHEIHTTSVLNET